MWNLLSALLIDPEMLRTGLEEMMDQERSRSRNYPDHEAKAWLERLAEADRMRGGYQELAAKGLMRIEELGARMEELENTRGITSDELEAIRLRAERLEGPEQDRDALMEFYTGAVSEELERLKREERRRVYRMLRLEVSVRPDGTLEAHGIFGESVRVGSQNGRAVCEIELAQSRKYHRILWTMIASSPASGSRVVPVILSSPSFREVAELDAAHKLLPLLAAGRSPGRFGRD